MYGRSFCCRTQVLCCSSQPRQMPAPAVHGVTCTPYSHGASIRIMPRDRQMNPLQTHSVINLPVPAPWNRGGRQRNILIVRSGGSRWWEKGAGRGGDVFGPYPWQSPGSTTGVISGVISELWTQLWTMDSHTIYRGDLAFPSLKTVVPR